MAGAGSGARGGGGEASRRNRLTVPQQHVPRHIPPSRGTIVTCGPNEYRVGLYGWRRRCLYGLVLLLLVAVILNLALTLFILRVIDFSTNGLGSLQIISGGVIANGQVHVMDALVAAKIISRPESPIRILASHNISLAATDDQGKPTNTMLLNGEALECTSGKFLVSDEQGRILFSATKEEVLVGARYLTVTGEGGTVFSGSVQTSHLSAPPGKSLHLESATRSLEIVAPQGVAVESRAGTIHASCLNDFTLQSTGGVIMFNTSKIFVHGLLTSTVTNSDSGDINPDVYQVCVCYNGRLFLAPPNGICAADQEFCK